MVEEVSYSYLVRIEGRVQGVWYRGWTVKQAKKLGLSGWVKNLPDGSVEALVSGPQTAVRQMLLDFQNGPPASKVISVTAKLADLPQNTDFKWLKK